MIFRVYEMSLATGQSTGYEAHHVAKTAEEAARQVLYTARLKHPHAQLGVTKRVVHLGDSDTCRVVVTRKEHRA